MSFNGKVTIISGANKNLGHETAIAFAKEGSDIALHYHSASSKAETEKLAKTLEKEYGVKTFVISGDLSVEKEATALFAETIKHLGKVDYAINNVGMVLRKPLAETSVEEFDTMFRINTKAAFLFLREAANRVSENGSVVMLTTSLLAAYCDGYSVYQASKQAVHTMCRTLSKETSKNISFNCISPGPMDTPFLHGQETPERIEFFKSQANSGRLGKVEDIVPILKFIVKDGHWMTGQNVFASNGFTAP